MKEILLYIWEDLKDWCIELPKRVSVWLNKRNQRQAEERERANNELFVSTLAYHVQDIVFEIDLLVEEDTYLITKFKDRPDVVTVSECLRGLDSYLELSYPPGFPTQNKDYVLEKCIRLHDNLRLKDITNDFKSKRNISRKIYAEACQGYPRYQNGEIKIRLKLGYR